MSTTEPSSNGNANPAPAAVTADPAQVVTPNPTAAADPGKGSSEPAPASNPFAELETETQEWLSKRDIKDAKAAAKLAHEQSKLLGNAIRIPGKDAKPEEIAAFEEKLGVPKSADDYAFELPKDLPPELPYDAERATEFKKLAKEAKLSTAQAKAVHDWAVKNAVGDFTGAREVEDARKVEIAKGETQKLVKLWGPLDGETMKANLAFADKFLVEAGGEPAIAELKRVGLIGDANKVILSAPLAEMFAKAGMALYKEDAVLRGNPDRIGNPFADGANFNMTAQMQTIKENPSLAHSLITAAGKKPSDFGADAEGKFQ